MERCCALWKISVHTQYEDEMVADEDLLLRHKTVQTQGTLLTVQTQRNLLLCRILSLVRNCCSGALEFLVEGKQTNKLIYQRGFRWYHRVCKPWSMRQISSINLLRNDTDCLEISYEHYFLLVLYFQQLYMAVVG